MSNFNFGPSLSLVRIPVKFPQFIISVYTYMSCNIYYSSDGQTYWCLFVFIQDLFLCFSVKISLKDVIHQMSSYILLLLVCSIQTKPVFWKSVSALTGFLNSQTGFVFFSVFQEFSFGAGSCMAVVGYWIHLRFSAAV